MKKVLIVVDYQNDFVSGSLGFESASAIEQTIVSKINAALEQGVDVIFTRDTHDDSYLSTVEGQKLPVVHCISGSHGWQVTDVLLPYLEKAVRVFEKPTFGSLELAEFLHKQAYTSVEIVGLVSHICVLSNAMLAKAALPDAEILVDAAGTASYDDALQEKAFDVLEGVHIHVINR